MLLIVFDIREEEEACYIIVSVHGVVVDSCDLKKPVNRKPMFLVKIN